MIEYQYFNGCPNSEKTLINLKELVNEGFISESDLFIIAAPNLEVSERVNFQGSPTILCDRVDIYTEEIPTDFNYTCRVYDFDGERTGILSKEYIKKQIAKLRSPSLTITTKF